MTLQSTPLHIATGKSLPCLVTIADARHLRKDPMLISTQSYHRLYRHKNNTRFLKFAMGFLLHFLSTMWETLRSAYHHVWQARLGQGEDVAPSWRLRQLLEMLRESVTDNISCLLMNNCQWPLTEGLASRRSLDRASRSFRLGRLSPRCGS